jgi:hypothetical protein
MTQTNLLKKDLSQVGEEIPHELGAQMVKDYQMANPVGRKAYFIGRNIMDQILAQPGCVGMKFYNAYNEEGEKTLVYLGVDEFGNSISEYTVVNNDGSFDTKKAIIADRTRDFGDDDNFWTFIRKCFS